jgi:hypothetical protein
MHHGQEEKHYFKWESVSQKSIRYIGFRIRIWGDTCGEVRKLTLKLNNFWENAPIKVTHQNLDLLTLLLISSTMNLLRFFRGNFFPFKYSNDYFQSNFLGVTRKMSSRKSKNMHSRKNLKRISGFKFEWAISNEAPSRKSESVNRKLADSTTGVAPKHVSKTHASTRRYLSGKKDDVMVKSFYAFKAFM